MNGLLDEYRCIAIEHGKNTQKGDSEATNDAYRRLVKVAKSIMASGHGNQLFTLFDDNDLWVQLWAATHSLGIDEAKSIAKLEELCTTNDSKLVSFSARYTIRSWQNGELAPIC